VPVTNLKPAIITDSNLFQDSLQANTNNNYTITFTPINALPADGSIKLIYPEQISLSTTGDDATKCFVTTNKLFSDKCTIDTVSRTVTIKGVFATAAPYSTEITIMLQNVKNPIDNRRFKDPNDATGELYIDGFDLSTYGDADQLYIQDEAIQVMVPILACDYPCASCIESDRTDCTACWQHNPTDIPLMYLMTYVESKGLCKTECDFDFTSNGDPDHRCTNCDTSCEDCADDGKVDDAKQCISCSETHPYRWKETKICLNTCNQGIFEKSLFQLSEDKCADCEDPCKGCYNSGSFCTSCY